MKWWGWFLALLPACIGILVAVLAENGIIITDSILYLRGNLSTLSLRLGLTLSTVIIGIAYLVGNLQKKHQNEVMRLREEISKERRRFLERLDHELKNPLTAIQAGLSNIEREPIDKELNEEVAAIKSQVMRISQLIADVRKLATLETLPLEKTDVNVGEILTEVVSAVKSHTAEAHREITLIIPSAPWPLPYIKGDPDLFLLAVHNLLDNAIKFTVPDDTIEIRAYQNSNQVVIEVADTGPGIPEEELELVWEELYRGEQARSVPGSGLGLPLVQAIIQLHGGQIQLQSRPNQGTIFTLRLPTV
ncbi:MAG: HAMP domain-containing sensor histidine kinase [Anaerolineales bacterium]|jgi:two-component system OmpR family sensor kinase